MGEDRRMGFGSCSNFRFFEESLGPPFQMSSSSEKSLTSAMREFCGGQATGDWACTRFGIFSQFSRRSML